MVTFASVVEKKSNSKDVSYKVVYDTGTNIREIYIKMSGFSLSQCYSDILYLSDLTYIIQRLSHSDL